MRLPAVGLVLLLGVGLGVGGHVAWLSLADRVTASGVLRQEAPAPPGASASFPAGFYVESRVYLRTAPPNLLGRTVSAWGRQGRATDPDATAYPLIENGDLTWVK